MKLFKYEGYKVVVSEEALSIKAFRELVKRDRSQNKDRAFMELSFIYFFADPRSDFAYLIDDESREEEIKIQQGFPADWYPDSKVLNAIKVYQELTVTTASLTLLDLRHLINEIRGYMRSVKLTTDTEPKEVASLVAIGDKLPGLLEKFFKVEKLLTNEIEENGKMKANKIKKVAEDGFDFIK